MAEAGEYRVLARKYRPRDFSELIGQDALVRTLTNAIQTGRIAHAFMLTGVRGVGKTTTARIIARALNCTGPDGTGGPTVSPCGVCDSCIAISADRHVDVMEMDAASRTGVDDIREILDGVRYAPVSARTKIYIIDEVHMLSKGAFNALLKTLEEPPPSVVFIFATTEIRRVPVTVLSRCQRFDLKRVPVEVLSAHYDKVSTLEGFEVSAEALQLIGRAADGSVRDGLSILDQALALSPDKTVSADAVRDLLGLADRGRLLDLFAAIARGQVEPALSGLAQLHAAGADPLIVLQDLAEITHMVTRLKLVPTLADHGLSDTERAAGAPLAAALSLPVLTRLWQVILKGLGEVQSAPDPAAAAEMVVIRLLHLADLPTPGDLVKRLQAEGAGSAPMPGGNGGGGGGSGPRMMAVAGGQPVRAAQPAPAPAAAPAGSPLPADLRALYELFMDKREGILATEIYRHLHLVAFEPGRIEARIGAGASATLVNRLSSLLSEWTGRQWFVTLSRQPGDPSLYEQDKAEGRRQMEEALAHPLVKQIMDAFPGAKLEQVRRLEIEIPAGEDSPDHPHDPID